MEYIITVVLAHLQWLDGVSADTCESIIRRQSAPITAAFTRQIPAREASGPQTNPHTRFTDSACLMVSDIKEQIALCLEDVRPGHLIFEGWMARQFTEVLAIKGSRRQVLPIRY